MVFLFDDIVTFRFKTVCRIVTCIYDDLCNLNAFLYKGGMCTVKGMLNRDMSFGDTLFVNVVL